jgi:hypothetical protein
MMFIVEESLKLSSIASQSLVFQGSVSLRNKRSHCLQMFSHLLASADTVSVLDDEQDTAMLLARKAFIKMQFDAARPMAR